MRIGQYAEMKKNYKTRVGVLKDGSLVGRLFGSSLEPHVREPDVPCDRTLWPSGGLAHGRILALPPLRPIAAIAADRGDRREESWPSLDTALGRVFNRTDPVVVSLRNPG